MQWQNNGDKRKVREMSEFLKALEDLNDNNFRYLEKLETETLYDLNLFGSSIPTIRKALRIAHALTQEPSCEAIRAGANVKIFGVDDVVGFMTALDVFKTISKEIIKEATD